ncbi:hypothetical protein GCM10010961_37980 [Pseudodonghicola xiamenensis]|uniref:Uncharacterized protein n=1 Tax=Pseudodonghicola xiamenensis TaxID=337702 RepID=A0A8J3HBU6_9RHOB|nr:hypothetical protein GCM10010961_37980 [Pseudodonghicola xiamenensis]
MLLGVGFGGTFVFAAAQRLQGYPLARQCKRANTPNSGSMRAQITGIAAKSPLPSDVRAS